MAGSSNMPSPSLAGYDFGPVIMLVILLCGLAGSAFVVVFRFAGRKIERLDWWWDDYFALISLVLLGGGFWADYEIMFYTSDNPERFLIYVYIVNILYTLVCATTKISGLLLYVLHFGYEKGSRRVAYALMAMVVFWCLATLGGTIVQCRSIAAAWSAEAASRPGADCLDRPLFFEATSIANATLTLLVLVLPLPKIWRLGPRSAGNVSLLIQVYTIGFFVLACIILRAYYSIFFQPSPILSPSPMATFTPFFFWTKLAESFGINAICMQPAMPAILAVFKCSFERPRDRHSRKASRRLQRRIVSDGFEPLIIGKEDERWAKEMGMKVVEVEGAASTKSDKVRKFREELDRDIAANSSIGDGKSLYRGVSSAGTSREWLDRGDRRTLSVRSAESAWTAYSREWLGGSRGSSKAPSVRTAYTGHTRGYSRESWESLPRIYEARARDEELGFGVAV